MPQAWHWQERFDALDPEDACRRQVLKAQSRGCWERLGRSNSFGNGQVQKQISYKQWLQQKKREALDQPHDQTETREAVEAKQMENEKRFKAWVRNKQHEKSKHQKDEQPTRTRPKGDEPFVKPPSLHVNPIVKRPRFKKQPAKEGSTRATPDQNAVVYAEWERRKKREDRVKRHHEQLRRQLQEHAAKLHHLLPWKKKDVVCAYSTNHRPATPNSSQTLVKSSLT